MSNLKRATNLDNNIMIRACAGAGKTYALTKRYINILDDFAKDSLNKPIESWRGPRNILVITFTKKATAEMANRMYDEVYNLVHGKEVNQSDDLPEFGKNITTLAKKDSRYIPWLQREFSRSQIMTIDALCHMILMDNPIKAGIDPGISTEDEAEVQELINNAQNDFIRILAKEYDPDLKTLIDGLGLFNVRQYLPYLDKHPVEFEHTLELFKHSNTDILSKWRDLYEPKGLPIDDVISEFIGFIKEITANTFCDKISAQWEEYERVVDQYDEYPIDERISYFAEDIHPFYLTGKNYRKSLYTGNQGNWKDAGLTANDKRDFDNRVKEFMQSLNERLPVTLIDRLFTSYDTHAIPLIRSLLNVYSRYVEYLEKRKRQEGIITFTDVIVKTRKLLQSETSIGQKYCDRYDHILVDEFQDTNDLRWDIVKSIASGDSEIREKGIFLVGDEKQSIYRFTNADVTVMNRTQTDLTKTGNFDLIEFDDNYRSSDFLIQKCINPLFKNILYNENDGQSDGIKKQEYEAKFQKTHYPDNKPPLSSEFDKKINSFFDLDILAVTADQKDEFKKNPLSYPRHVARLVKNVLTRIKDQPEWDALQGSPRIGILVRQMKTNSILFREAFQVEGVELEIVGGRGFWSRQEVMDIEAVLSFLINPLDDVAMITLLRSPIFSYDDIILNDLLKEDRRGKSIYEVITNEYLDLRLELTDWISKSKHQPIDRLLLNIFNDNHRDLGYFSEMDGKQRWANLQKCINLIHAWSLQGKSLSDIRQRIRERSQQKAEGEFAVLPTTSDVVLMSIHQAKGLEFPIVIAPDLQRNSQHSRTSSILLERLYSEDGSSQIELGLTINTITGDSGQTALLKALKEQVKAEEFAESKRLLYVAVTRAKYGVLLSGYVEELSRGFSDPKELNDANNFLDWVRGIYGITGDMIAGGTPPDSFDNPNISIPHFENDSVEMNPVEKITLDLSDKNIEHPKYKRVSVHDLLDKNKIFSKEVGVKSKLSGITFGNLIHKIFEKNWLNYDLHRDDILTWALSEGIADIEENEGDVKEYLVKLQKWSMTQKISQIPDSGKYTEHTLSGFICSNDEMKVYELSGIIDLLYHDSDEWVVLDYKTDINHDLQPRYVKQIQLYLQMIKYLYGFEKVRGEIFYTTDGMIVPVEFQDNYIGQLEIEGKKGWEFLAKDKVPGELRQDYSDIEEDAIIICPTRRWAIELKMMLSKQGKLLPSHSILYPRIFNDIIDLGHLREPSQINKRAIVRKIFNNRFAGKNFYDYPGLLSSIVSAFDYINQHHLKPQKRIEDDYIRYEEELIKNNFCNDITPLLEDQIDWDKRQLIVDGCIAVTEKELGVYKTLSEKAEQVKYFPLNGDPQTEFNYDLENLSFDEITIPSSAEIHYYRPFDLEAELEVLSTNILSEREKGIDFEDMLIVLPSMELYVPRLLNVLHRYQIPLTLAKREPIIERPIIKAAMTLLKLIQQENPNWQTVRTGFTHPISLSIIPEPYREDFEENLKILDIVLRRSGKIKFNEADDIFFSTLEADNKFPKHLVNSAKKAAGNISSGLKSIRCEDESEVGKEFESIIESITVDYSSDDEMEIRSLDELLKSLKHLNKVVEETGLELPGFIFQRELEEALSSIEIPTAEQDWGIQVVSVPDSTNIRRKAIFALGLSQSDFPSITEGNFLVDGYEDYHDVTNRLIFQSWFENFKKVYLTCPVKNSDGKDQQYSVFLEPLGKPEGIPTILTDINYSRIKETIGKEIQCEYEDPILNRQIDRHNDILLNNPLDTRYFGSLGSQQDHMIERPLSATQLDELANKPLFFLLRRGWNITETDKDSSDAMQRGSLVHEILEGFGNLTPDDGWTINRKDKELAKKKMVEVFEATLDRKQLAIKSDLEIYATYHPFILESDNTDICGLLFKILDEDLSRIKNFKFASAEQRFSFKDGWEIYEINRPTLGTIQFRGKIDRIDRNEETKIIVAVDFKTGNMDWNSVEQYRAFQLPLYYQVLKREYPDYKTLITFRQIKSLKDNDYGFNNYWLGDISDTGIPEVGIFKHKRHIGNTEVMEVDDKILSTLLPIEDGKFRLYVDGLDSSDVDYYYLNAASRLETVKFIVESL